MILSVYFHSLIIGPSQDDPRSREISVVADVLTILSVNPFYRDLLIACILASRVALTNPIPRGKISQYSPWRGLSSEHPFSRDEHTVGFNADEAIHSENSCRQAKVVTLVVCVQNIE